MGKTLSLIHKPPGINVFTYTTKPELDDGGLVSGIETKA